MYSLSFICCISLHGFMYATFGSGYRPMDAAIVSRSNLRVNSVNSAVSASSKIWSAYLLVSYSQSAVSLSSLASLFSIDSLSPPSQPISYCTAPSSSGTIHQAPSAYLSAGSDWTVF